jgi:hypothetical protein
MVDLPPAFVRAVNEGRYRDAATDPDLQARGGDDPLARPLLILAAAHATALAGKRDGAALTFGHAIHLLEHEPLDPYAALLIEHARACLGALHGRTALPRLPVSFG